MAVLIYINLKMKGILLVVEEFRLKEYERE